MALQPCMDLINTFPLVDAQEFVDLGGEETKIKGLDELEAMLTEQVKLLKQQLQTEDMEQSLYADLTVYDASNKTTQSLDQQI